MTYLVGGGGGGITSVNSDAGPVVVLDASEVGAIPGEIAANEATLIAIASIDGTIGYAQTEDTYWKRTEGKWIRLGSNPNKIVTTNYSNLDFSNGDVLKHDLFENGHFILDGALAIGTDYNTNAEVGLSIYNNVVTNATVSTKPETTITFAGKTVNVGRITFVASSPFTADFADIWGNNEEMSLWSALPLLTTPPTKTAGHDFMSFVLITTGADAKWYLIYDYVTESTANDSLLVIPLDQVLTAFQGGTPTLSAMATASGIKASVLTKITNLKNKNIPGFFTIPQEDYSTNGSAIGGVNNGQTFIVGGFKNSVNGVVSLATILGTDENTTSVAPIIYLEHDGLGAHVHFAPRGSDPTWVAPTQEGQLAYVTDRFRYYDGAAAQSIASETWVKTPRIQTVVSAASVTPNASTNDAVTITAQAVGLTIANFTGTAVDFQRLTIRIKDNGVAQTIAFGTNYIPMGVALPAITVAGKIMRLDFEYDAVTAKFGLIQLNQEA